MTRICAGLGLLVALVGPSALGAPLVVLDPGHGGIHDGAKTEDGVVEKEIVLRIAQHARTALSRTKTQVLLTRASDRTLGLKARTKLARDRGAVAFVSIHNNWAPVSTRRGVETYVLSASASDDEAVSLLHTEEAEFEASNTVAVPSASDLEVILGDLDRQSAHEESARLASKIQKHLGAVPGLGPSRGLRQAPFKVLQGATMASVLVEIGYLSHVRQGKLLSTQRGQRAAGEALAKGIRAFLSAREKR